MGELTIVGCPVYDRAWILPLWFDRIKKQTVPLSDLGFVFVVSSDDRETVDELFKFQSRNPSLQVFDVIYVDRVKHESHREHPAKLYSRNWGRNKDGLMRMTELRNVMLSSVRMIAPDFFLSLDSDILLDDPVTIETLQKSAGDGAVSPLVYMSDRTVHPNIMNFKNSDPHKFQGVPYAVRIDKPELDSLFQADIIMGAKMMSPRAYNVDYLYHPKGEDIGWSWNCKQNRVNLYCNTSVYAPHILSRKMLELYTSFGDAREPKLLSKL